MSSKRLTHLGGRVVDGAACLEFYVAGGKDRPDPAPVRVCRAECPAFTFGKDYEEFFHGLEVRSAQEIFTGTLNPLNGRKFKFRDPSVAVGCTYAYWVRHEQDQTPCGPVALRVRNPRVWWSEAEIARRLARVAAQSSGLAELVTFGRTVEGRALRGLVAGSRERTAAFVGVVHAGEAGPELLIPAVEKLVAEQPELLKRAGLVVLPCVNLDQRVRLVEGVPWYLRTNAAGVDLNRNFDAGWDVTDYMYGLDSSERSSPTYRGPAPASEPETQAVVSLVKQCRPRVVFSMHCLASICGDSFLTAKTAEQDAAFLGAARVWAETYRRGMYPDATTNVSFSCGCSTGSLPGWLYVHGRIPNFDLELGTNDDARPCVTDLTTPELLAAYQARHFGGMRAVLERLAEE